MCWVHSCIHLNRMFRSGFWFHTPTALLLHSLVSSQTAILWTPHAMASSWLFAFAGPPAAGGIPLCPLSPWWNSAYPSELNSKVTLWPLLPNIAPRVGCPSTVLLQPCIYNPSEKSHNIGFQLFISLLSYSVGFTLLETSDCIFFCCCFFLLLFYFFIIPRTECDIWQT